MVSPIEVPLATGSLLPSAQGASLSAVDENQRAGTIILGAQGNYTIDIKLDAIDNYFVLHISEKEVYATLDKPASSKIVGDILLEASSNCPQIGDGCPVAFVTFEPQAQTAKVKAHLDKVIPTGASARLRLRLYSFAQRHRTAPVGECCSNDFQVSRKASAEENKKRRKFNGTRTYYDS